MHIHKHGQIRITKLDFLKGKFDVIWCEGVIDSLGFEKSLKYWSEFLKENGYMAVTSPSWLTDDRPAEAVNFWSAEGCELDSVHGNTEVMRKCGYDVIATFTLPEKCWTEGYYIPRSLAEKAVAEKYGDNEIVREYIASSKHEIDLYSEHNRRYGYVFYVGRKAARNEQ